MADVPHCLKVLVLRDACSLTCSIYLGMDHAPFVDIEFKFFSCSRLLHVFTCSFPGLTKHATILAHMFSIAESGGITVPLFDPAQPENSNLTNEVFF